MLLRMCCAARSVLPKRVLASGFPGALFELPRRLVTHAYGTCMLAMEGRMVIAAFPVGCCGRVIFRVLRALCL